MEDFVEVNENDSPDKRLMAYKKMRQQLLD